MARPIQPETKKLIAFSDCDPFRHLNNARYIDYFLDARETHIEEAYGISLVEWASKGRSWVVTQNQLAYLRPAVYRETIMLVSRLIDYSTTTLKVEMLMMDEVRSHIKAVYWAGFTHIGLADGKKAVHPEDFMTLLEEIRYSEEDMETGFFEKRLLQIKQSAAALPR
ncbi:MAG TPA: acyl-CoA thioesterase [Flavisolibacter sp.]|nr:acyl-CoA thioesterase [Flavisolibacter sp.]